ncbi:hypothetical protein JOB18_030962 [Solea senegalensis]|uniref:Uncharacterized protein n=1 Tax=Solea senegalensis TaxID=28829 RepID=A0AAV6PX76_SOLSE|nr:hypothetical protein JOB18_030962 [Solea senegalensis]
MDAESIRIIKKIQPPLLTPSTSCCRPSKTGSQARRELFLFCLPPPARPVLSSDTEMTNPSCQLDKPTTRLFGAGITHSVKNKRQ